MKRSWSMVLVLTAALAFAACGNDDNVGTQDTNQPEDTQTIDHGSTVDVPAVTDEGGRDTVVPADIPSEDVRLDEVEPADVPTDAEPDAAGGSLTPPDLRTTYVYRMYSGGPDGYEDLPGLLQQDTVEYDGGTWYKGVVGNFNAESANGLAVYVAPHADEIMGVGLTFKACEVYSGDTTPQFWYSFDPPLNAYANVEVGVKQTVTGTGELGFSFDSPMPMDATVEYTLVTKNASVEVPYGTVDGCWHYSVDAWEALDGGEATGPMHVDVYVKPDFGIVSISMVPGYGAMELVSVQFPE